MGTEHIVLVDDDRVIQKMVGGFLERRGYKVSRASDGVEALRLIEKDVPDLVITDVRMPELNGLELTARLRGNHRTAAVPILMFSALNETADSIAGYAVGADEYLPKPFELAVLEAKVLALLTRTARSGGSEPGSVILFAHAKGGVGTTSLAVNTAVLLSERSSRPVGLLDLDVEFGDSAVYLNVHPSLTLADLKTSSATLVDEALFETFVTETGRLRLVVGADLPERADEVTLPAVRLAIDMLRAKCQYLVIDVPASFTQRTLTAMVASDAICLVTSASLPSLKSTRGCLDMFHKLGFADKPTYLILNDSTAHAMRTDTVMSILGRRPDCVVRRSEGLDRAANEGHPLVISEPDNPLVTDLRALADLLAAGTRGIAAQRAV
jgi:pilus assembly protein CpaE